MTDIEFHLDTRHPYCDRCGAKCDFLPVLHKYSPLTGKALYKIRLRCPNKTWFLDKHKDKVAEYVIRNPGLPVGWRITSGLEVYTAKEVQERFGEEPGD